MGEFCEYANPCLTAPRCQNGGTCDVLIKDGQASFQCKCPVGYSASLCEISEETACSSSPCRNNGKCFLKSLREYECRCPEGFSGKNILFSLIIMKDTNIFIRLGKNCEKSNLCATSPCKNGGTCSILPNGNKFKCICPLGFKGTTCSEDVQECANSPCKHGGTCLNTHGSYQWVQCWLLKHLSWLCLLRAKLQFWSGYCWAHN